MPPLFNDLERLVTEFVNKIGEPFKIDPTTGVKKRRAVNRKKSPI